MLQKFLSLVIHEGDLTVVDPRGRTMRFGDGAGSGIVVRIHRWRTIAGLILSPEFYLGEGYVDGSLAFERGDIFQLLDLVGRNWARRGARRRNRRWSAHLARWLFQWNGRRAARRNASYHYDLSDELYRSFLDPDLQYSCAYFPKPDLTLEQAQAAKKAYLASKLFLQPGMRVLDIGSGWGGLALTLAEMSGVEVLGVTLSARQLAVARERASAGGLGARVRFALRDYRDVEGSFDRIVSVGMLEHVGRLNYRSYFEKIAQLLSGDGVAVIHSIGYRGEPGPTNPWISKYIFPGGHMPSLSEVLPAIEAAGLWATDIEVLRLHYAETLLCWRERFLAQRSGVAQLHGERFCRMWEFYLGISEIAFRHLGQMVFQIQLAKRVDAVPITRDYLYEPNMEPIAASRSAEVCLRRAG